MPRLHECIGVMLLVLLGCTDATVADAGIDATPSSIDGEVAAQESLVLGVLPFVAPSLVDTIYAPLANVLSDELDVMVRLRTAASFPAFDRNVRDLDYDIALVQPFELVRLLDQGFQPLVRVDEHLVATVVAQPDFEVAGNSIRVLADLRVGTPPEGSAVRRLLDAELLAVGLQPGVMNITAFPTHGDCLGQLRLRVVDVCAVGPVPLREYQRQTGEDLQVVVTTEPVASIAYLARPGLDPEVARAVQTFLLELDETDTGLAILEGVGTRRYVAIEAGDYERVGALLAASSS